MTDHMKYCFYNIRLSDMTYNQGVCWAEKSTLLHLATKYPGALITFHQEITKEEYEMLNKCYIQKKNDALTGE